MNDASERSGRLGWLPILVLAGAVIAVYGPTIRHAFVYDDARFIAENSALESIDPVAFLVDPSTVDPSGGWEGIYRPLRTLSFAIDVAIFGREPAAFHAVNALLHLANSLLLFGLLRRLVAGRAAPLLGALFFAIHPVMVEGVAWATSRDNGLCLAFLLLAMRAYLGGEDGPWRLTALGAAFSFALLSKETAIMLPALLVWYELSIGARVASLRGAVVDAVRRRWRAYTTVAIVVIVYLFLRYEVLGESSAQRSVWWEDSPLVTRMTGVVSLATGLLRIVVPVLPRVFTFDYQLGLVQTVSDWRFVVSAVVAVGLIAVAIFGRRRFARTSFFAFWYLLLLLPTANFLVPINILYADRFLYLAAAGPLAWLATVVVGAGRRSPRVAQVAIGAWLGLFLVVAVSNVAAWRDPSTLWHRVLDNFPHNPRALRAYAYSLSGESPDALTERRVFLERALEIEPDYPPARRDLGELLRRMGETEDAIRQFEILVRRVEQSPIRQGLAEYVYACRELVTMYSESGRFEAALGYAERLLPFAPDDVGLRLMLGRLAERLGQSGLARSYYIEALQIDPRSVEAGEALNRMGR